MRASLFRQSSLVVVPFPLLALRRRQGLGVQPHMMKLDSDLFVATRYEVELSYFVTSVLILFFPGLLKVRFSAAGRSPLSVMPRSPMGGRTCNVGGVKPAFAAAAPLLHALLQVPFHGSLGPRYWVVRTSISASVLGSQRRGNRAANSPDDRGACRGGLWSGSASARPA